MTYLNTKMSAKPSVVLLVLLMFPIVGAGLTEPGYQDIIELHLHYDHGNISVQGVFVENGYLHAYPEATGPYLVRTVAENGTTLYARQFDISTELTDGIPDLQVVDKTLVLPYTETAEWLRVYRDGQTLFVLDIPKTDTGKPAVEQEPISKLQQHPLIIGAAVLLAILAVILYLSIVPDQSR